MRLLRVTVFGLGWLFIAAGVVIALYLVYSLYWTSFETRAAQADLRDTWELQVGEVRGTLAEEVAALTGDVRPQALQPPEVGDAVAALEFVRPGSDVRPVLPDPVLVVHGVTTEALQRGPGHYPGTALPGQAGNFAVAGHRTTYDAPFFDLDQLLPGDEIHVTDRDGARWVYEVVQQRIVTPQAVEVLDGDPLGNGRATLTLTTCNPRFSNAQRLIVFAQLRDSQAPLVASAWIP